MIPDFAPWTGMVSAIAATIGLPYLVWKYWNERDSARRQFLKDDAAAARELVAAAESGAHPLVIEAQVAVMQIKAKPTAGEVRVLLGATSPMRAFSLLYKARGLLEFRLSDGLEPAFVFPIKYSESEVRRRVKLWCVSLYFLSAALAVAYGGCLAKVFDSPPAERVALLVLSLFLILPAGIALLRFGQFRAAEELCAELEAEQRSAPQEIAAEVHESSKKHE